MLYLVSLKKRNCNGLQKKINVSGLNVMSLCFHIRSLNVNGLHLVTYYPTWRHVKFIIVAKMQHKQMYARTVGWKVLKQYFHQRSGNYQIAECLPKFKCRAYQSLPNVRKTERKILLFWNIKTKSTLKVDFLYSWTQPDN